MKKTIEELENKIKELESPLKKEDISNSSLASEKTKVRFKNEMQEIEHISLLKNKNKYLKTGIRWKLMLKNK